MTKKPPLLALGTLVLLGLLASPAPAQAQDRGGARIRVGGYWGPGYGYGYGCCYGWGGPWGPWGPYGWYGGPYYGYGYGYGWASARVEVQPKQAEVFVDGSAAGIVDDFDSWYQSLNVQPGEHDIAIYLKGYRTQHHQLYFSPGSTQHIKGALEKQAPGEPPEARPRPMPPPAPPAQPQEPGSQQRPDGRPLAPPQQQYPPQPPTGQEPPPEPAPMVRFGTLSLRVQPGDAEVLVDRELWTTAVTDTRLSLKLSAGRHVIEVHKSGYETYVETVLIRPEATMALNVGLTKK